MAAVLKTRVAELRERTLPILAAMEANGSPTVRQIAEALVRPIAEMGANYVSFLIVVSDHPKYARLGSSEFEEPSLDLLHAFGKALPELPAEVRPAYRFAVAEILANQALGNRRKRLLVWLQHLHPGGEVDYVEALIDFIAGGLAAPTDDDGLLVLHGAGVPTRRRRSERSVPPSAPSARPALCVGSVDATLGVRCPAGQEALGDAPLSGDNRLAGQRHRVGVVGGEPGDDFAGDFRRVAEVVSVSAGVPRSLALRGAR